MGEERIVEMEIKIAYQEDLLQALNTVLTKQQQQITRLEETCKYLNERIKTMVGSSEISQEAEVPPHY